MALSYENIKIIASIALILLIIALLIMVRLIKQKEEYKNLLMGIFEVLNTKGVNPKQIYDEALDLVLSKNGGENNGQNKNQ